MSSLCRTRTTSDSMSSVRMGSLAGLPVILEGQARCRVERPVLEKDGKRLRGLVVRRGLGSARWVDREAIELIGLVSVIVRVRPVRLPSDTDFALGSVRDASGLTLGRVTDAWLDPETLRVEALEIVPGLVEALLSGPLRCDRFAVCPCREEPGRVMIPGGLWLERSAASRDRDGGR